MTTLFREVKRKANVGERIRVVNPMFAHTYGKDDVGTVISSGPHGVTARIDGKSEDSGIWHHEYVVLEPVTPAPPQQLDFPEALALFMRENAAAIRKYLDEIEQPAQPKPLTSTPKLSRAEVIAKAKADVAELTEKMRSIVRQQFGNYAFKNMLLRPEFHVNRAKRAVTALVRKDGAALGYADGALVEKATAKAAPGDVFHAEIGKAIALRKALGLPVPDEYINAPQPDEPRVGTVVMWTSRRHGVKRTTLTERVPQYDGYTFGNYAFLHTATSGWIADKQYVIIDDTDVDYGEAA